MDLWLLHKKLVLALCIQSKLKIIIQTKTSRAKKREEEKPRSTSASNNVGKELILERLTGYTRIATSNDEDAAVSGNILAKQWG